MAIGQGGKEGPSRLSRPSLDFVFAHLPRERVAMDAERVGRLRQAAVELAEDARDESFFELVHRVVELHPFVHHFLDELLQPLGDHLFSFRAGAPPPARLLGDSAPRNGSGLFSFRAGAPPPARLLGDSAPRNGSGLFSFRAGAPPPARLLGDSAPRNGSGAVFFSRRGPTPGAAARRLRASQRLRAVQVPVREAPKRLDVFFARAGDDIRRQRWNGRLLVPPNRFEIIADELLVEAWLRTAGRVAILRPETR